MLKSSSNLRNPRKKTANSFLFLSLSFCGFRVNTKCVILKNQPSRSTNHSVDPTYHGHLTLKNVCGWAFPESALIDYFCNIMQKGVLYLHLSYLHPPIRLFLQPFVICIVRSSYTSFDIFHVLNQKHLCAQIIHFSVLSSTSL